MCCPKGYTEEYYHDHPDEYHRHPAMFLGQVCSLYYVLTQQSTTTKALP
eukprot:COSAG06_NODE_44612_length_362_cov_0.581749_1_plen_48_part_01